MLFTVAFYDIVVVPLTVKCGRPISMVKRIGIGFVVEMLALLSAGLIETARYKMVQNNGLVAAWNADTSPTKEYTDAAYSEPMSIWWQFLPYFLLGAAEAFTNIGVMELFYTQVSDGMRALGTAIYLLSVAIGTYMATALNIIIAAATKSDPWVADNPLFGCGLGRDVLMRVCVFWGGEAGGKGERLRRAAAAAHRAHLNPPPQHTHTHPTRPPTLQNQSV